MKAIITDVDALTAINTLAVHAYLRAQHWTRCDDLGDRGIVYTLDDKFEVFAPGSERLGDYAASISSLIEDIARAEDRDAIAVYRDLATSDRDLIRFRAPHADDDGSVDLNAGVDLIQQCKDALLAAACSTVDPKRSYRIGKNKEANDYLRNVKLGQTEHGSFVVTLYSPVPPELEPTQQGLWSDFETEPFNRRVTRTLATAMDSVLGALDQVSRGEKIEAFERVVGMGVSANLCSAIAKFVEDGNGLDFSLTWAKTRPAPEARHRAVFSHGHATILAEAAKVLKSRESLSNEVLEGYVSKLNRDQTQTSGLVSIKTFIDGKPKSVTSELPQDLYKMAIEAHDSQSAIRIEGDLTYEGQRWYLKSPKNIEKIEESEQD